VLSGGAEVKGWKATAWPSAPSNTVYG
jgi:hypothetical protein